MEERLTPKQITSPDIDFRGAHVRSVLRLDKEMLITLAGGAGQWLDEGTGIPTYIGKDRNVTIAISIEGADEEANAAIDVYLRDLTGALEMIRTEKMQVSVKSAPGHPMFLMLSEDQFLSLPRANS